MRALTFEYNGIARQELNSAKSIAASAGVREHRFVRLPDLKEAGDIPHAVFEGLPPTYIPLRNSVFYSLAASYAEEIGASAIAGGHNKDDAEVFEDVGTEFFTHLQRALRAGSVSLRRNRLQILRPLKQKTKVGVLKLASGLGVPLELTWSCHGDGDAPCMECPGCTSRRLAFSGAKLGDPLPGATRKIT